MTLGLEDLTQTVELRTPLFAGIAPEQAFCNYLTLTFRNVAGLQAENVGVGAFARAAVVLSPNGPNAEGFPSASVRKRTVDRNSRRQLGDRLNDHVRVNPYPNVAGPGQPKDCEAGNETYLPGKAVIGNLPASSLTSNRELTTREQNLFGEKYPSATLKALGLEKAKSKPKQAPKPKPKKTQKGKRK